MIGMLSLRPSITIYGLAGDTEMCNKINGLCCLQLWFSTVKFSVNSSCNGSVFQLFNTQGQVLGKILGVMSCMSRVNMQTNPA